MYIFVLLWYLTDNLHDAAKYYLIIGGFIWTAYIAFKTTLAWLRRND